MGSEGRATALPHPLSGSGRTRCPWCQYINDDITPQDVSDIVTGVAKEERHTCGHCGRLITVERDWSWTSYPVNPAPVAEKGE